MFFKISGFLHGTAESGHTHFPVRLCVDRLAGEGGHTVAEAMKTPDGTSRHHLEIQTKGGGTEVALLDVRWRRTGILPPLGKQGHWPALDPTVIHAMERGMGRAHWIQRRFDAPPAWDRLLLNAAATFISTPVKAATIRHSPMK